MFRVTSTCILQFAVSMCCDISVVDLPQGWEMNIVGGRPYYVEYVCLCFSH